MPNSLLAPWVKNVNKQRTTPGKKSVCLFTELYASYHRVTKTNVQQRLYQLFYLSFPMFISTPNQTLPYLLFGVYTHYPHPLLLKS